MDLTSFDSSSAAFTLGNINNQLGEGSFNTFYAGEIEKIIGPIADQPLTIRRWANFMNTYYVNMNAVREVYSDYERKRLLAISDIAVGYIFGAIFLIVLLLAITLIAAHVIEWETGFIMIILALVFIWLFAVAYRQTMVAYINVSQKSLMDDIQNEYVSDFPAAILAANEAFSKSPSTFNF